MLILYCDVCREYCDWNEPHAFISSRGEGQYILSVQTAVLNSGANNPPLKQRG